MIAYDSTTTIIIYPSIYPIILSSHEKQHLCSILCRVVVIREKNDEPVLSIILYNNKEQKK